MAETSLLIGAAIFGAIGVGHGLLTLGDAIRPRILTPTDEKIREAMQGAQLKLSPNANLWRSWLGFNLSHSVGLMVFGGGLLAIAIWHFDAFENSRALQIASLAVAASYVAMSLRFFFWAPVVGSTLGFASLVVAVVSVWGRAAA